MTITFIPATQDPILEGAADAATRHFAKVGVTDETMRVFQETSAEAGLVVQWMGPSEGHHGLFSLDYAAEP